MLWGKGFSVWLLKVMFQHANVGKLNLWLPLQHHHNHNQIPTHHIIQNLMTDIVQVPLADQRVQLDCVRWQVFLALHQVQVYSKTRGFHLQGQLHQISDLLARRDLKKTRLNWH